MPVTVVFRVRTLPSDWGRSLAIVGNLRDLSTWGLSGPPLPLQTSGEEFTRTFSLPARTHVEYKYVLVDAGRIVSWERLPFDNRRLHTGNDRATIFVDDGIFGSDEHVTVRRVEFRDGPADTKARALPRVDAAGAPGDDLPAKIDRDQPPALDAAQEAVELVKQLEAARTNVESVRASLRSLPRFSAPPSVDEEAALPLCDEPAPARADWAAASLLVHCCLSEGAVLLRLLRALQGAKGLRRTARKPGAHALAVASFAACVALLLALFLVSPQLARGTRRRVWEGADLVRGAVGERGWREVVVALSGRVREAVETAKEGVCERAGWPRLCGEKPVPVVEVIETEVAGVTTGLRTCAIPWLEDLVHAVTGRRRPALAEAACLWLPRPVRRLLGARE